MSDKRGNAIIEYGLEKYGEGYHEGYQIGIRRSKHESYYAGYVRGITSGILVGGISIMIATLSVLFLRQSNT